MSARDTQDRCSILPTHGEWQSEKMAGPESLVDRLGRPAALYLEHFVFEKQYVFTEAGGV